jgi:hypothetical protein
VQFLLRWRSLSFGESLKANQAFISFLPTFYLQRAAPFAPLPIGYPKNYIDIEFTFDINVYGELNLYRDGG